ncbi:MAG: metalloregulator ArsR/SmtB family transcription factor [Verrucomicrobiota bacterium]
MNRIFQALADPTRREILERVSRESPQASDLASSFSMSFPAVSKHLKVLERAGLLRRDVEGRVHRFSLKPRALKSAYDWIHDYEQFWNANLDQLDAFLKKNKEKKP